MIVDCVFVGLTYGTYRKYSCCCFYKIIIDANVMMHACESVYDYESVYARERVRLCMCLSMWISDSVCVCVLCVSVWLCDCVSVRMTVHDYVWLCVSVCVYDCASVHNCVWLCVSECVIVIKTMPHWARQSWSLSGWFTLESLTSERSLPLTAIITPVKRLFWALLM